MRLENTWQEIRDHSFIQNLSRSSRFTAPWRCFFSSTGFRSEDCNGHSRSLVLCPVTHFCAVFEVCVWIIVRLEDPIMAHYKISNRDSHLLIFYLLIFDRIHDAMCLNKMSRTSNRNIGPQHPNVLTLCINCGSIWKQVMEIYCQLRNRLYWRDAHENRMWLIAQP